jgi:protein gp37
MANNSSIEWTEATWNPVAGCTILSPGCTHCYAMRMARRLEAMGQSKYSGTTRISGGRAKWNGRIVLDYAALELPLKWKKPKTIFVNSMSDLFHEDVPFDFIYDVFRTMRIAEQHTFQVLTKRSDRLAEIAGELPWPNNVWMGVSVECEDYVDRIDDLRSTPATIKFLSLEPLLGPLDNLDLRGIDWAIAGGESGARIMQVPWVRSIRDQCKSANVAFHFKQWGGVQKKQAGRILDGRTWDELPTQHHAMSQPSY